MNNEQLDKLRSKLEKQGYTTREAQDNAIKSHNLDDLKYRDAVKKISDLPPPATFNPDAGKVVKDMKTRDPLLDFAAGKKTPTTPKPAMKDILDPKRSFLSDLDAEIDAASKAETGKLLKQKAPMELPAMSPAEKVKAYKQSVAGRKGPRVTLPKADPALLEAATPAAVTAEIRQMAREAITDKNFLRQVWNAAKRNPKAAAAVTLLGGPLVVAKLLGPEEEKKSTPTPAPSKKKEESGPAVLSVTEDTVIAPKDKPPPELAPIYKAADNAYAAALKDDDKLSSQEYTNAYSEFDKKIQELPEVDRAPFNDKRQMLRKAYEANKNKLEWREVAEMLSQALAQLGAGYYGLKHGVDMSGLKFNKRDWDAKFNQLMKEYGFDIELTESEERKAEKDTDKKRELLRAEADRRLKERLGTLQTMSRQRRLDAEIKRDMAKYEASDLVTKYQHDKEKLARYRELEDARKKRAHELDLKEAEANKVGERAELRQDQQTAKRRRQIMAKVQKARLSGDDRDMASAAAELATELNISAAEALNIVEDQEAEIFPSTSSKSTSTSSDKVIVTKDGKSLRIPRSDLEAALRDEYELER